MITVEDVSKSFNKKVAVDGISFSVEEGETLVLLGVSGCGKTTTLRMINRLLDSDTGRISVNGRDVKKQAPEKLRRSIGYVLQNTGLLPHYTVAQNMAIVPKLLSWNKTRIKDRALQLLQKLHLGPELLSTYPSELSGGQQQRVGLARALMANPSVLLMDEPFGALDLITRASIRKEFKNLDELKRKTMVMVTHDVTEAFDLGDRICLMNEGKIIQVGTPAELLFSPANDFVDVFLEEQKSQLQFNTVKLSELWPYLPCTASSLNGFPISTKTTLWEAMSVLLDNSKGGIIKNEDTGEVKEVHFAELMNSFKTYRSNK